MLVKCVHLREMDVFCLLQLWISSKQKVGYIFSSPCQDYGEVTGTVALAERTAGKYFLLWDNGRISLLSVCVINLCTSGLPQSWN